MKKIRFNKCIAKFTAFILIFCCLFCLAACSDEFSAVKKASAKLSTYQLEVGFDDSTKTISAVLNFVYINNTQTELSELKFHLYANAYREDAAKKLVSPTLTNRAYKNGYSYGNINIESVEQEGVDLAFQIGGDDCNILIVPLASPVSVGKKATVKICFDTTLANIWHRTGYGDHTVNLNNWYPILCHFDNQNGWLTDCYNSFGDPFVSDAANYQVNLSVGEDYKVAAGADLVSREVNAATARYCFEANGIRDFSIVMSPLFEQKTATVGKTTITYFYFDDPDADQTLKMSADALQYFNSSFGLYPYGTLAVVQSDFFEGGMEYPRLAMVSFGLSDSAYKKAAVHEIAHQWWYGVVGNDQVRNAWIDEGLAEYSTHLFFSNHDYGIDASAEMEASRQGLNNYLDITGNYYSDTDTSMNRSLSDFRNETEYAYMCYVKPMIMFDDLYLLMGQNKFLRALKNFYSQNLLAICSVDALSESFSKAYGADMSKIFGAYIEGKEKTLKTK